MNFNKLLPKCYHRTAFPTTLVVSCHSHTAASLQYKETVVLSDESFHSSSHASQRVRRSVQVDRAVEPSVQPNTYHQYKYWWSLVQPNKSVEHVVLELTHCLICPRRALGSQRSRPTCSIWGGGWAKWSTCSASDEISTFFGLSQSDSYGIIIRVNSWLQFACLDFRGLVVSWLFIYLLVVKTRSHY